MPSLGIDETERRNHREPVCCAGPGETVELGMQQLEHSPGDGGGRVHTSAFPIIQARLCALQA
jgi:hypothetical protein